MKRKKKIVFGKVYWIRFRVWEEVQNKSESAFYFTESVCIEWKEEENVTHFNQASKVTYNYMKYTITGITWNIGYSLASARKNVFSLVWILSILVLCIVKISNCCNYVSTLCVQCVIQYIAVDIKTKTDTSIIKYEILLKIFQRSMQLYRSYDNITNSLTLWHLLFA